MMGRMLPAAVSFTSVLLTLAAAAAQIPTIDAAPAFSETLSDTGFGDGLDLDDSLAIVGAPDLRQAQLWRRQPDSSWQLLTHVLEPSDGTPNDDFGIAVAIDGQTLVVGARLDSSRDDYNGAAYVFESSDANRNEWTLTQKLLPPDPFPDGFAAGRLFGRAVDVAGDTLIVGSVGAAYIYERTGPAQSPWILVATVDKLTQAGGTAFAGAVSLLQDVAAVGHPEFGDETGYETNTGAVFVYSRDQGGPNVWGEVQRIDVPVEWSEEFGVEVALGRSPLPSSPYVLAAQTDIMILGEYSSSEVFLYELPFPYGGTFEEVSSFNAYDPIWGLRMRIDGDVLLVLGGAGPEPRGVHRIERTAGGTWQPTAKYVSDETTTLGSTLAVSNGLHLAGISGSDRAVFLLPPPIIFHGGFEGGEPSEWSLVLP